MHDAVADRVRRRDVTKCCDGWDVKTLAVQVLFTLGQQLLARKRGELQRRGPRVDGIDDDCASIAGMDPQFNLLDRYWRAANYLTVGQIYLQDEPAAARAARGPSTSSRACSATGAPRPG